MSLEGILKNPLRAYVTYSGETVEEDQKAVALVLGVCRLGDADLAGWWSSHSLDMVGEYVLSDLFPRTWRPAALQLSLLSALKRHQDFLPARPNMIHLFSDRLGVAQRAHEYLSELKTGGDELILDELQGWADRSTADAALANWAGTSPRGERVGQSLRLGLLPGDALDDETQRIAAVHLLAASFVGQDGDLLIPYFDVAV